MVPCQNMLRTCAYSPGQVHSLLEVGAGEVSWLLLIVQGAMP